MRIEPAETRHLSWFRRWIFRRQRKIHGQEFIAGRVWARVPKLFIAFGRFYHAVIRKSSPLDPTLRRLVMIHIAKLNRCDYCSDLNSYLLKRETGLTETGAPRSDKELAALDYATAVTGRAVTDDLFARLHSHFSDEEIVELTALISCQSASCLFNTALAVPSQDFAVDTN